MSRPQAMSWPDPVHYVPDKGWFFWDETWTDQNGPYQSEQECRSEMNRYCKEVLGI